MIRQPEIVWRVAGRFVLAEQLELRLAQARKQVEPKFDTSSGLRPPSPRSRRRRAALLAHAWTHSLPAHSGCALSIRKSLFTRSHRVQIASQFSSQNPSDQPAEKLLEQINAARRATYGSANARQ